MEDFELFTDDQIGNIFLNDDDGVKDPSNNNDDTDNNQDGDNGDEDYGELTINPFDNHDDNSDDEGGEKKEINKKEGGNKTSTKDDGTSLNNFYSSIANALVESGATPDLSVEKIKDPESFAEAIKDYCKSQIDEMQKRVYDALNDGMQPNEIKFYENVIRNLDSINDELIEDEDNIKLRKDLIVQDLINKGYTKEEAEEEYNDILDDGMDIKRAKKAHASTKSFYSKEYSRRVNEAKEANDKIVANRKAELENIRKDILENKEIFEGVEFTKEERQQAYDAISKPVYKDPESGQYLTAVQKYQKENGSDFIKKLGILFVKTNNFKTLDNLINKEVQKKSKKIWNELESKINNTRRSSDGNLRFAGGDFDDNSRFAGYKLNL